MRAFVMIVVLVGLVVLGPRLMGERLAGEDGMPAVGAAAADAPPELQGVLRRLRDAQPAALSSLLGGDRPEPSSTPEPSFADGGPRRDIARVKRAVRRALRSEDVRVQSWQGVIVSDGRAMVRADVQPLVEMGSGEPAAGPTERITLGLRDDDGWQIVTG